MQNEGNIQFNALIPISMKRNLVRVLRDQRRAQRQWLMEQIQQLVEEHDHGRDESDSSSER